MNVSNLHFLPSESLQVSCESEQGFQIAPATSEDSVAETVSETTSCTISDLSDTHSQQKDLSQLPDALEVTVSLSCANVIVVSSTIFSLPYYLE